ncbi:MAG TPA: DUF4406 domain-containing protein [Phycisphaerae bacterium]|nr:DUF4406 domain-containing protein [Phycisphaerae bacterium]
MSKRIYISGPMTGIDRHNFPAFHAAARRMRAVGWRVVNPAENFGGRTDLPREVYMRVDVALLALCDAIALLPGWQDSRGARAEYLLAREMGLEVRDAVTLRRMAEVPEATVQIAAADEPVLAEAQRLTGGARQSSYGHPREDFARTALMWTGILRGKLRPGEAVAPGDVPLCMIAVKLARQTHQHKRDNLVDIAGYARTAAMVAGDE